MMYNNNNNNTLLRMNTRMVVIGVACVLLLQLSTVVIAEQGECLSNATLEAIFTGGLTTEERTCCQSDICGLPCPQTVPRPPPGKSFF